MTRKQRRGIMVGGGVLLLSISLALILFAMRDTVVFFYSPSELSEKQIAAGQRIRIGGLVADGSVIRGQGTKVGFAVTDTQKTLHVTYEGILPDLFREGQGVVAEGRLQEDGSFVADTVLAKHDENYMPPEVAAALRARGVNVDGSAIHPASAPAAATQ
ncbi:MAG: cytochrome c maturation protein CcmE [Hyphomicrobiaceae bacterium]